MFGGQVAQAGLLSGGRAGTHQGSGGALSSTHDGAGSAEIATQLAELSRTLREHHEAHNKQLTTALLEMKAAVISADPSMSAHRAGQEASDKQTPAKIRPVVEQEVAETVGRCSKVLEGVSAQINRASARASKGALPLAAGSSTGATLSSCRPSSRSSRASAAASKLVSSGI